MPQAAAIWVFEAMIGAGIYGVGIVSTAMALAYVGTTLVISLALASITRSLMPTPKGLRGRTVEYGGTVEARRIIYGEVRVGGLNAIPPIVTGSNGENLHQVLVVAGHEVSDITDVWFNQTKIPDATIAAADGSPPSSDGAISSGTYAGKAWIRRYTGNQVTADAILNAASPNWTDNHVGYGLAYLAIQFMYDKTTYAATGKPEVSAMVLGKKVYDPRLDTTNGGAGSHRYTDSSTWEYSNNPALCLADYLMDANVGMGESATRIDWTTVAAAANECDEVVSVPTGSSPEATSQYRYRCNIVLEATDRYEDNIEAICTTMLGHCYYTAGTWQIHAGAWSASAFTLTEDDIVGSVSITADIPRNQKYNAVRGQFYDSDRNYQPSEFQPRTNATYESADGERIWREVDFRGVTNEYEAQRNAIIVLRRGRNRRTVSADFSMAAFKVRPFETGTLTLAEIGWTAEPVRCIAWEFRPEGTVRLTLQEESSTDWSNPAIADYTYVSGASEPAKAGYVPPTPTSLTATPVTNGVLLSWVVAETAPGTYFEILRESDSTLSSPITSLATTYGTTYVDVDQNSTIYYYWVRAVSASGTPSGIYPAGAGISAYRVSRSLVPDPNFELGADFGEYWTTVDFTASSTTNLNTTYTATADSPNPAISGGLVSITFPASTECWMLLVPMRNPPVAVATGEYIEVIMRWRRTGTIGGGSNVLIGPYCALAAGIDTDYWADGSVVGSLQTHKTGPYADNWTVSGLEGDSSSPLASNNFGYYTANQWQETRWLLEMGNLPKNQTQRPYLAMALEVRCNSNAAVSGTIQIDHLDIRLVDGGNSQLII